MLKGLASDISGKADICLPVRDLSKCLAVDYLVPGETIVFSLQSAKEEFTFTNEAVLFVEGSNATTTRKLVTRYRYKSNVISKVAFESAGRVDRDCEIKFKIGDTSISIDVARAEDATAQLYYKVLELLSRAQLANVRNWDFCKTALKHSAEALRLTEQSGQTLTRQSDEVVAWMQRQYAHYNPECYRDVINNAFEQVQAGRKSVAGHP
ncbi:hypothetical protein Poli38472_011900 [Pythium oligandrum]|uniref:Bacterial Pleckstrin homology domain-containing protein n=1 Tax=Pythium oligandrum TaxID=41045 RepID=A0A8K1C833_PYTOL|nr:hypothetical protein Poli38472_011900 [Pythium oligandrum]|eukprot:TMW58312.1 hypothetical protein Poli38472_011900 [Pythium oligandrum]